jgi:hypothetical protein
LLIEMVLEQPIMDPVQPVGREWLEAFDQVEIPGDGLCYVGAPLALYYGRQATREECSEFVVRYCNFIKENGHLKIPELDNVKYWDHIQNTLKAEKTQLCHDGGLVQLNTKQYLAKLQERGEDGEILCWGDYGLIGWAISTILDMHIYVHHDDNGEVKAEYLSLSNLGARQKDCHVWHTGSGTVYEHFTLLKEKAYESDNEDDMGTTAAANTATTTAANTVTAATPDADDMGTTAAADTATTAAANTATATPDADVMGTTAAADTATTAAANTATATPDADDMGTTAAADTATTGGGTLAVSSHFQCCFISCTKPIGGEDKLGKACNICERQHIAAGNDVLGAFLQPRFCHTHVAHKHHKKDKSYAVRPPYESTTGPITIASKPTKKKSATVAVPVARNKRKLPLSQVY